MDLCDIRDVKSLLSRHGFRFSKSMGQNFLIADWVPREIAAACGAAGAHGVLEVGPGIGPLTRELCGRAARVASIELDRSLYPVLAETLADCPNFTLIPGDVLQLDLSALLDQHLPGLPVLACANLPYNITTPALRALVETNRFESITVMVQKEVAQRIAARPGTPDYGAFSVYMQFFTQPELLFDVPPDCFLPAPKVTSAVVRCVTRTTPPAAFSCGVPFFFRTVRAAFALRRKTLRNSLASAFGPELDRERIAGVLAGAGLPPTVRGEELGLPELAVLADLLWENFSEGKSKEFL